MKIGIIGTGNMGRTLGIVWAQNGHEVFFGGRDAEKLARTAELIAALGKTARTGTNDAAAAFGEVIFYSPRDIDPKRILADISVLDSKVVLDPANEMPPRPDWLNYQNIETLSLAERLQGRIPKARVVKAFNTVPQEALTQNAETLQTNHATVFIAGNDEAARQMAAALAEEIGFHVVDCGTIEASRHLEAAARFLIYLLGERGLGSGTTINIAILPKSPNGALFGDREADRAYS